MISNDGVENFQKGGVFAERCGSGWDLGGGSDSERWERWFVGEVGEEVEVCCVVVGEIVDVLLLLLLLFSLSFHFTSLYCTSLHLDCAVL